MSNKKDIIKRYNLPSKVKFCKRCTISNQRPRIKFDDDGICSACKFSIFKRTKIDWNARKKELENLLSKHRKNDGSYDVIVPCSGGKDGSFVAHRLKNEYGMNPLCVTWAPLASTELGKENLQSFIASGFNHILGTPNPITTRKLTQLSFREIGDPFQPFIYGQTNFPLTIAVQNNIQLIFYGENGEVEYGGDMKNAFVPTRTITDHNKHYFSSYSPTVWTKYGCTENELKPFLAPSHQSITKNKTQIHFFGYYEFWDPQENYYYAQKNTGFKPNDQRSEGTYSKYSSLDDKLDGFHYYLSYIKFGIGRATSDTAHEIRDGKIDREEGIALIKRYDSEFPKKYFDFFLEYCNLSENEFNKIVDSWRSSHLWEKHSNGTWFLKNPIWEE
tara:strand:+ start:85 stop:1248 length:1164 start_codon:yes stop_codon:yes gene_type:complete